MVNPEWTKLITQEIMVYFIESLPNLYIYKDGGADLRQTTWAELYIDGPNYKKISNDRYKARLGIELLLISPIDLNPLSHEELMGQIQSKLLCIPISLGILYLQENPMGDDIETISLGLDKELNQLSTSIHSVYELDLIKE